MRFPIWLLATLCAPALALPLLPAADEKAPASPIGWKKTVLDKVFRSEGVAVADVNHDGKLDVLTREVWYEAPTWKMHNILEPKAYDPHGYSHSFACWADDLNGDGWADLIVIDFPGIPCYWLENPRNGSGPWKQHIIWHSACNETPQYVDLFGTGKRVLVMGWQPKGKEVEGQMAWFRPGQDPTQLWEMHPISVPSIPATYKLSVAALAALEKTDKLPSADITGLAELKDRTFTTPQELQAAVVKAIGAAEAKTYGKKVLQRATVPGKQVPGTFRYSHGLGVGDINGDGRLDVICTDGWWEQAATVGAKPWPFHPAPISEASADLFAYDVDGDGKADVLSSSAHRYGIWWSRQLAGTPHPTFQRRDLFPKLFSQSHALHVVDINGDGLKDLVTGKRWWAHGPKGDADPQRPAVLYWFEARKGKDGFTTFTPHRIDDDSGIGTQFAVTDVNGDGLLDIVVSNKKGTFLFEQTRTGRVRK